MGRNPRLAEVAADSEERWMLETQLVRDRNRVTDALADAGTILEESMARLRRPASCRSASR